MVRTKFQKQKYRETHNAILQVLKKNGGRLTFGQICIKVRRSRPVVSQHLKDLIEEEKVRYNDDPNEWPRHYYLTVKLIRLKRIMDILKLQEEYNREVKREFELAHAVGGDEGAKKEKAIIKREYEQKIFLYEKLKEKGDSLAAVKLKAMTIEYQEYNEFEQELKKTTPNEKFKVLMKWRKKWAY